MNVLIVEPGKVPREAEIGSSLKDMQEIVDGYIEAVYPYDDPVALTKQLSVLRREVKLCEGIRARSEEIPQKLKEAKQEEQNYETEMMKHEHQRGRGGPGR